MTAPVPAWGADTPISMPLAPDEPVLVDMYGFGVTQYRLVHSINEADYERLSVPVYAPVQDPAMPVVLDDLGIEQDPPQRGA